MTVPVSKAPLVDRVVNEVLVKFREACVEYGVKVSQNDPEVHRKMMDSGQLVFDTVRALVEAASLNRLSGDDVWYEVQKGDKRPRTKDIVYGPWSQHREFPEAREEGTKGVEHWRILKCEVVESSD